MSDHLVVADSKEEAVEKAKQIHQQRHADATRRELRRRYRLASQCKDDVETRMMEKRACREDVRRFINNWVYAYNPWHTGKPLPTKMPFTLRPKQSEFIGWLGGLLDDEENGLVEKSRREGASYLCLAFGLHHWLFKEGFSMTVGSRKFEKQVEDKGNLDCLIPKVRYMLYALPKWMRPEGFEPDQHDNEARLLNPEQNTSITGEAGDNMGRGGRSTFYLIDEWAHVQRQDMVNAAVSQNSLVHVKISTPAGSQDKMHEEKRSGRYRTFRLHWRDNPVKNYTAGVETDDGVQTIYPWYEEEKRKEDPVTIAQEIDIDYGASADNVVIPSKWVNAAVEINLPTGARRTAGLDVSGGNDDKTVLTIRAGPSVEAVTPLNVREADQADEVERISRDAGIERLTYDRMGVGSGITATLKKNERELPFTVYGLTNSDVPTNRKFRDAPNVPCDERFKDLAAELWWALRLRFKASYEALNGEENHLPTDCISIPDRSTLIGELSQPTYSKTASGKIKIDKFGEGTSSPDEGESVMYAFAEKITAGFESATTVQANVN